MMMHHARAQRFGNKKQTNMAIVVATEKKCFKGSTKDW